VAVISPNGALWSGVACGIKRGTDPDLGLIVLDDPSSWAGTFTRNAAAAAPVLWSKSKLGRPVRAVVVNSGNANACTGTRGSEAVEREVDAVAQHIGCAPSEVLVASTGPIGVPLPVERITSSVPAAVEGLDVSVDAFARAIMTTDTVPKIATARAGRSAVLAVGKGAAMLAPNMATMLSFIVTDASIDAETLQKILDVAVDTSFNRISVDACESTNDSVFMFATGTAGECDVDALATATEVVTKDLATQMVRDAEGGSKLIRIVVDGAPDDRTAAELGRGVASSALWRAAAYGGDPNWGRVLSALGASDRSLEMTDVSVAIGDATVYARGEPAAELESARNAMRDPEVVVRCVVGPGGGSAEVLTSDLSPRYVELNAEGTT